MADVKVLKTTILLRRATQAQWDAIAGTFIPKAGEPCVTLDGKNKGQIKIGDGTTPWGELKYAGVVEGALNFKGSVQTKAELPEVANVGDIYQVIEDSTMYIWDGDSWEIFHAIDLTGYATKEEVNALKNENLKQAVLNEGCKQIILCGIETHICLYQTAMNLKEMGYDVTIISDCSGSRAELEHLSALQELRSNNISIKTTEMILFELLKTAKHEKFKEVQALIK